MYTWKVSCLLVFLLLREYIHVHVHEKEEERSVHVHVHCIMRDEKEERKKQARSNKQTRQSNTAHPR